MIDCLRGERGCYCWASGPQLVRKSSSMHEATYKNLKSSLSVLIRFFFMAFIAFFRWKLLCSTALVSLFGTPLGGLF